MVRGGCWVATADTQTQEITPNLNASKMFVRSAAGFWSLALFSATKLTKLQSLFRVQGVGRSLPRLIVYW